MKKILAAAFAATTMLATPAFAQAEDESAFEVTASVPGVCTIGDIGDIDLSSLNVNTTAGASALTLVNSGTYVADETSDKFWVSCNDTNKMTVSSANQGYLVSDGPAPTDTQTAEGFVNRIAYHIGAVGYLGSNLSDWQFQPTLNEGTNNNYNGDSRGAIHREVGMRARVTSHQKNANKRPLAGDYSDTVTVTVQIAA